MGIFVDEEGFIYIADSGNNRIQKFDARRQFIGKWGTDGIGDGQLNYPSGIAMDSRGFVYVSDRDNNRIQVFKLASDSESE